MKNNLFICLAVLASMLMPATQGHAQDAPPDAQAGAPVPQVEFSVWSRQYAGTLGNKAVEVSLARVADTLAGTYCYRPCSDATRYALRLEGTLADGGATLDERGAPGAAAQPPLTGEWIVDTFTATGLAGRWMRPNATHVLPIALAEQHDGKPFPYEIRLAADRMPDPEGCASEAPRVSAIRLYRGDMLVQSLATDSTGTCSLFTPEVVDVNFDGWPDLMLAQSLPAGPNIPYDYWLYSPATGRYIEGPESLRDITSPAFDAARKLVWNGSRGSCCEHAIDIYRWHGQELEHIDGGESYYMPVKIGGKIRYCYVLPDYHDGHVEYPDAVWDGGGPWALPAAQKAACAADDAGEAALGQPGRIRVDVWRPGASGTAPVLVKSEKARMRRVTIAGKPMDCPSVPVLDGGKIARLSIKDPGYCTEP